MQPRVLVADRQLHDTRRDLAFQFVDARADTGRRLISRMALRHVSTHLAILPFPSTALTHDGERESSTEKAQSDRNEHRELYLRLDRHTQTLRAWAVPVRVKGPDVQLAARMGHPAWICIQEHREASASVRTGLAIGK